MKSAVKNAPNLCQKIKIDILKYFLISLKPNNYTQKKCLQVLQASNNHEDIKRESKKFVCNHFA